LPDALKNEILAAIKPFPSISLLRNAHLQSRGRLIGIRGVEASLFERLRFELPKINEQEFRTLLNSPVDAQSEYAEKFGRDAEAALKYFLGVPHHRKRSNMGRDWQLARLLYEDPSKMPATETMEDCRRVADKWTRDHPDEPVMDANSVRSAVHRIRDQFRDDSWDRRLYTYVMNFPKIDSLTCSACKGSGIVPNESGAAWLEWNRRQRSRQIGRLEQPGTSVTGELTVPAESAAPLEDDPVEPSVQSAEPAATAQGEHAADVSDREPRVKGRPPRCKICRGSGRIPPQIL
jgi:hypothetical protein